MYQQKYTSISFDSIARSLLLIFTNVFYAQAHHIFHDKYIYCAMFVICFFFVVVVVWICILWFWSNFAANNNTELPNIYKTNFQHWIGFHITICAARNRNLTCACMWIFLFSLHFIIFISNSSSSCSFTFNWFFHFLFLAY